jgi:uncharacterized membrane-anchored protein
LSSAMAKKRRRTKPKEEEYEFVPPDFDEREFILKDIYGTKILLVVSLLAILMGIVASFIHKAWEWYGGMLLLILVIAGMKELMKLLRFDLDLIEAKTMVGNYILFFLLSLGTWILLINPPFA